jgi:hypothetical protein
MSRLFDGVDDIMTFTTPSTSWTFGSVLIVAKFAGADGTWQSLVEVTDAAAAPRMSLGRRNSGELYMANSFSLESEGPAVAADGWSIYCVTKATGTVNPTSHVAPIGGARTSSTFGTTLPNGAGTGVRIHIGGPGDFANIYVAAAAVWNGVVLTTGQIDGILSAKTTQSILDLSPTWAADDSDAFATDLTSGTSDRTAITGTTDSADDPSGWLYFGASVAASLPMVPPRNRRRGRPAPGLTAR